MSGRVPRRAATRLSAFSPADTVTIVEWRVYLSFANDGVISIVGIHTLEMRPIHGGGTIHMHQRQTAAADQALDGTQGNTKLLGWFAPGYQRSPRHNPRI